MGLGFSVVALRVVRCGRGGRGGGGTAFVSLGLS